MAVQKPRDSAGKITGFPYQLLWEELEPDWEAFRLDPKDYAWIEARFAAARKLGAPPHLCLRLDEIMTAVEPLGLPEVAAERLALHLHWLAGIYLSREHGKLLNNGPEQVRERLQHLSKAAKNLNGALTILTPETLALLMMVRSRAPHVVKPHDHFSLIDLLNVSRDLALTADCIIEELPGKGRGSTVDVLRGRWIWSATRAVETWAKQRVEIRQSDEQGTPKPRLINPAAETLFRYLKLARPKLTKGELVRVIVERRKANATGPARS